MSDDFDLSSNADGASKKLDEVQQKIFDNMSKKMEKALATIELDAKRNVHSNQGALSAGITHKQEQTEDEIIGTLGVGGPAGEYAVYVHQGTGLYAINGNGRKEVPWAYKDLLTGKFYKTSGQKPNPFLQKAIDDNKDNLNKIFEESDLK